MKMVVFRNVLPAYEDGTVPKRLPAYEDGTVFRNVLPAYEYGTVFRNVLPAYEDGSVPKRRHMKFRLRGITQQNANNVQNTAKV